MDGKQIVNGKEIDERQTKNGRKIERKRVGQGSAASYRTKFGSTLKTY